MLVLSANYITFLYSCYLENNPSSNDIIHICCQLFSNYLRECVVFLSMLVLMPLLSVELHVCTMTITSYLGDWAQYPVVCNFVINVIMNRGLINCIQFALSACCHIVTM